MSNISRHLNMKHLFILFGLSVCYANSMKIFGDSILVSDSPIQKDLETWSGVQMQNYATVGAGLQPGWVISIPEEYERNRDPVPETILMDGGGNDINSARSECTSFSKSCQETVDKLVNIADDLITRMRNDGVQNIIYNGFYYIPEFRQVIDYGTEEIKKVCRIEKRCFFVDLRNITIERGWDGMHPVTQGYHDIAKEIWKTKLQHNITFS